MEEKVRSDDDDDTPSTTAVIVIVMSNLISVLVGARLVLIITKFVYARSNAYQAQKDTELESLVP